MVREQSVVEEMVFFSLGRMNGGGKSSFLSLAISSDTASYRSSST